MRADTSVFPPTPRPVAALNEEPPRSSSGVDS